MNIYSNDSEEDEWYCNSIRRYGKLIMFEIENEIQQIELCDVSSVYALCKRKSGQNVLSKLSLPYKLRKNCEDGLIKDCDLKIKSGTFLDSPTTQIETLYRQNKVLLSQADIRGVSVYSLDTEKSDQIRKRNTIDFPLLNPTISLNCDLLVATKDSSQVTLLINIETGNIVYKILEIQIGKTLDNILPVFTSKYVIGLCEVSVGKMNLYDIRQSSPIGSIAGNARDDASWSVSSNYIGLEDCEEKSSSKIGLLSNTGLLKIFDYRNLSRPENDSNLGLKHPGQCHKLRFSPLNNNVISVSGLDGNVYIYDLKQGNPPELIFNHDGHRYTEMCEKKTLTTSHLWYEPGGENMLISGAENCSINCWQYNPKL